MKVVVVGGGPAGLVTLKFLATAHEYYPDLKAVDVQLFEAEDDIGGTFKYRVWDKSEVRICKASPCSWPRICSRDLSV